MNGLADFLHARIAEDEHWAREARGHTVNVSVGIEGAATLTHITRWSSARVLAECDAKRRIVEAEPERWVPQDGAPGSTVDMGCPEGMVRVYGKLITEMEFRERYMELAPPSQTLLFLAQPYADHPDYREEWKP